MTVGTGEILIKYLYLVLMKNDIGNIKECRALIRHHHVLVNGQYIDDDKYRVQEKDIIQVDHKFINAHPFVYYMLNKPKGYICANSDKKHNCVVDLIDVDCFCLGRLDKDTTGILLLTNDKSLSKQLLMPQFHVEKTYYVSTLNKLTDDLVLSFKEGIVIDQNVKCREAYLEIIDDYHCLITVYEGKYHQIKKMFLSIGNKVVQLKRISFANIELDQTLREGEYRSLNDKEFHILKEQLEIRR